MSSSRNTQGARTHTPAVVKKEEKKKTEQQQTHDLSDDRDIYRQHRLMYAPANTLIREYGTCSSSTVKVAVFIQLFVTRCTLPICGGVTKVAAFPNSMWRTMMWHEASLTSQSAKMEQRMLCMLLFHPVLLYSGIVLTVSSNGMIEVLVNAAVSASVRFTSTLWNHWRHNLCVNI